MLVGRVTGSRRPPGRRVLIGLDSQDHKCLRPSGFLDHGTRDHEKNKLFSPFHCLCQA